MARLMLEDAVMMTGRPAETIERWIVGGKVDAERSGGGWLIEMRSLLNVAAAEEMASNGNGHSGTHNQAPKSPIDAQPDEYGGRQNAPEAAAEAHAITGHPAPADPEPAPATVAPQLAMERAAAAYTVDVATSAIGALNNRLEQAMTEIERLQDERLKLALQLGYAQSQLKTAQEQLRMLTAPPEQPQPWWRRLLRRA